MHPFVIESAGNPLSQLDASRRPEVAEEELRQRAQQPLQLCLCELSRPGSELAAAKCVNEFPLSLARSASGSPLPATSHYYCRQSGHDPLFPILPCHSDIPHHSPSCPIIRRHSPSTRHSYLSRQYQPFPTTSHHSHHGPLPTNPTRYPSPTITILTTTRHYPPLPASPSHRQQECKQPTPPKCKPIYAGLQLAIARVACRDSRTYC